VLDIHREKWREVPGAADTDERRFFSALLSLADADLLNVWEGQARSRASGVIGWVGPLYRAYFASRRVLELGSGLGFDGMRFAIQGSEWTLR
jgi:hypothetical protein